MPPRRQILQRPTVTAPCYSVAALTVCVVMVGSVAPGVPTIGVIRQRMNPHHCTTWILDGPSRSNRKARDALRWMDGQAFKSTGIVNPKSSEIPTVCLKSCPLMPQTHRCAASWGLERGDFSWGHTATEVWDSHLWRRWEHLTVSVGWVCDKKSTFMGPKMRVEPRLEMGKGKCSKNVTVQISYGAMGDTEKRK